MRWFQPSGDKILHLEGITICIMEMRHEPREQPLYSHKRLVTNHYESVFEIEKPHFGHFVNSGDSQNWIFTRFLWLVQNTFGDSIPLWICTSTTFPSQNDDKLQSLMVLRMTQNDPE